MHHTSVVIGNIVTTDSVPRVTLEVEVDGLRDVLSVDVDILVSVWSSLLVLKPNCVPYLMNNRPFLQMYALFNHIVTISL